MEAGVGRPLGRAHIVRYGIRGAADIIGILAPRGGWIAIEVKVGKDTLRPGQLVFRGIIERSGGLYLVAREPIIPELEEVLEHDD